MRYQWRCAVANDSRVPFSGGTTVQLRGGPSIQCVRDAVYVARAIGSEIGNNTRHFIRSPEALKRYYGVPVVHLFPRCGRAIRDRHGCINERWANGICTNTARCELASVRPNETDDSV